MIKNNNELFRGYVPWRTAWPSGQCVGLAIRRSRVPILEFNSSTTLVNSQLVSCCELGFLIMLCFITGFIQKNATFFNDFLRTKSFFFKDCSLKCYFTSDTLFHFYKNIFYKNIEAELFRNFKNILRINPRLRCEILKRI